MSAKVIQEGFSTVGFNQAGEMVQHDVAIVHAEVPGPYGDWCYVVIGSNFCWVKGLEKGFNLYELPLKGSQDGWEQQIMNYVMGGPREDVPYTAVCVGVKKALAQDNFFIIAE